LEWVPEILELSKKYRIPVSGVSFHVGSECSNPEQFSKALQLCRIAIDLGTNYNMSMNIIDIGGGFLPSESNLHATASCINSERAKLFPDNLGPDNKELVWIAEPGRFLSAPSQTLYTPVIGKKRGMPSEPTEFRYTLHESIYGYFSNIPFDGQAPTFSLVHQVEKQPELTKDRTFSSILFGRTCDGADIINPNINLPLLNLGDWLMVPNMGSYTNVTASEFNGFPKPDMIYLS
jgi:ornithine decarboxylase